MNKPVIIVAPAGSGKSTAAQFLMQSQGCTRLVEEWDGRAPLQPGDLALVNAGFELDGQAVRVLTLDEVLALGRQAA